MTMNILRVGLLTFVLCEFAQADELAKGKFDGTWEYVAEHAPEGYQKGTMTINGKELELVIGGYQKYSAQDVNVEKDVLSFYTYVEGSRVNVRLEIKDGIVSGTADTEEGEIPIKLTKKK